MTKVISGTSTSFLYDLANPVQELSGTTPTANLLTGGLDEYFTRTDAGGTSNFLADALGSTVALTDTNGAVQVQYSFEPFGGTAQSGTSNTNTFAYTGRELDGTGLYYYRARYYSAMFGRFASEDPIGLAGGTNAYLYAGDDPTNFVDPLGKDKQKDGQNAQCIQTANQRFLNRTQGGSAWSSFTSAQPSVPKTLFTWGAGGLRNWNWSLRGLAWSYYLNVLWNGGSQAVDYWKNWSAANSQYEQDIAACQAQ